MTRSGQNEAIQYKAGCRWFFTSPVAEDRKAAGWAGVHGLSPCAAVQGQLDQTSKVFTDAGDSKMKITEKMAEVPYTTTIEVFPPKIQS